MNLQPRKKCDLGPVTVTYGGAFSPVTGMAFEGQSLSKGKGMIENIFNVLEKDCPQEQHITIWGKIIRATNVKEDPYNLRLEVERKTLKVVKSWCSCVAGAKEDCKHGAALYQYINHERTEGKTDKGQEWKTPSKKLQKMYLKMYKCAFQKFISLST